MKDTGCELTNTSQLSQESELVIVVSDRGVGLAPENPDDVFEPFVTSTRDGNLRTSIETSREVDRMTKFYLAEAQRLAHTGSWMFTAAGFEHWSSELFAIHGLDPGRKPPTVAEYMALVHRDDRGFVAQEIQTMLAEHRGFDFTKRIVRPDGTIRHVRCIGTPVTSAGVFQGLVGTGIDVTEQEEVTKALRNSEAELRQLLDRAPQIVGRLGPHRERLYANRAALAYYGVSLDAWRQRSFRSEVHPDDAERLNDYADRALSSGSAFELELRCRNGDGSYRWFLARYSPVRDDDGQIIHWYVACTDIDDRKRAEERLQQENVALREEIDKASMFEEIVGSSPALTAVLSRVSKVAGSDSTVLLTGETGTGKELVARAIHRRSRRASRAFVAVNCAAIPRELIASELFGHEKGAFHRSHPTAGRSIRAGRRRNDFPRRGGRTLAGHAGCAAESTAGTGVRAGRRTGADPS